ncbi:protein kinase [Pseudoxanthomonas helianthi]|uniref:Protein kinase n=1 Tax=Pseudoxanthomonas helianthi TaxID=1453541 RepID=A0A941ASF3_9GAMM|nr:protein kinase [Pseudoxanthomonas helianthi]
MAIKLLSGGPWASPEFVARFEQEARHAAQLQHPGIVAIHELGESIDGVYYAMQLVRGESLAQRLHEGDRWTPREAAVLLRHIAEAVAYAHSLGVLHLDLKPGNVLIDEHGHPLIADFGLARRIGVASDDEFVAGTPGYMAPEQAIAGHPLDEATDVWGLGAILHELLGGRPPGGDDGGALDATPSDLRAICHKCTAEAPGQRYASARALADDIGRFLDGRAVQARPLNAAQRLLRWARREPKLASALGLAVLILLVGTVATALQWRRAEASAKVAREQTWRVRGNSAWDAIRNGLTFEATSPLLANLREREAHGDSAGVLLERLRLGTLHRNNIQGIDAIDIGGPGFAVALNREGTLLAASSGEGVLRLFDVRTRRQLWRADTRNASHFWPTKVVYRIGFTRDGRHLLAERAGPRVVTRPSGQDSILVDAADGRTALPPPERFADFRDATYSEDGRFALLRNHRNETQLFQIDGWRALSERRAIDGVNPMWRIGDGARFVALSVPGRIEVLDPRTLAVRHIVHGASKSALLPAWAVQPGGDLLALGAADGAVRLLDTRRGSSRELKPGPYTSVEWLSFSPDGRWLAAAAGDRGFVWDVTSGQGGALPAGRFDASQIDVDAKRGTVFVVHPPEATLWQLPVDANGSTSLNQRIAAAEPLVPQLPIGSAAENHAATAAPATHLAASIDVEGELRLWRWRDDPILQTRAAPQIAAVLHFDGSHVATADGRVARVIAVDGERPVSPEFVHPQPVSQAFLASDDRSLVTVSGREIRVFDWRSGRLRHPPVVLVDSPLRVAASPGAEKLLVSTGAYRDGRFHEILSSYDLRKGVRLATDVAAPGPLHGLRFSPDGRLVVHWRYGELSVREASTLHKIGRDLHVGPDVASALRRVFADGWHPEAARQDELAGTPVVDASINAGGTRLSVLTGLSEFADAKLLQFDPSDGHLLSARTFGKRQPLGLLARRGGHVSVVWSTLGPQRLDGAGKEHPMQHLPGGLLKPQAISNDGHLLASASRQGVVVTDLDSGEWAAAPMTAPLPSDDTIVQLAFAPDAGSLLARSHHGRWVWWPLPRESRSVTTLQTLQSWLEDDSRGDPSLRAALRADDPGPPRVSTLRVHTPKPATPVVTQPGFAFVDLSAAINRDLDAANVVHSDDTGILSTLPSGVQRFLGIDYDIRGMVALAMPVRENIKPTVSTSVPVPVPRFDVAHLLMGACCMLQDMPGLLRVPYAFLDIAYADGSHARVPIVYGRDLMEAWTDTGDSLAARIAWVEPGPRATVFHGSGYRIYAVRLGNPYPTREVASLSFAATNAAWSGPMILATTLETGDAEKSGQAN